VVVLQQVLTSTGSSDEQAPKAAAVEPLHLLAALVLSYILPPVEVTPQKPSVVAMVEHATPSLASQQVSVAAVELPIFNEARVAAVPTLRPALQTESVARVPVTPPTLLQRNSQHSLFVHVVPAHMVAVVGVVPDAYGVSAFTVATDTPVPVQPA
jgi:hypothetical protein